MEVSFLGSVVFGVVLLIGLAVLITLLVLGIVLIKALIRYIKSKEVRAEKAVQDDAGICRRGNRRQQTGGF